MDSQHRHELGENELAAWLTRVLDKVQPYYSLIGISIVGIALIAVAMSYLRSSDRNKRASTWELYTMAMMESMPNQGVLLRAAEELEDSENAAQWANITWADGELLRASRAVLADRKATGEAIDGARKAYEKLLLVKNVNQPIRDRAQFGLARSYEIEGDLENAIAEYKKCEGTFAEVATKRAEELTQPGVKDEFAWLKTAEAPRFSIPSGPGIPGQSLDFNPDNLDAPMDTASEETETETGAPGESLLDLLGNPDGETPEEPADEGEASSSDAPESDAAKEQPAPEVPTAEEPEPAEEKPADAPPGDK